MIPVYWLAPGDQWDQTMLRDLIDGKLWRPVGMPEFEHFHGTLAGFEVPACIADGGLLVIPGRYYSNGADVEELARWVEAMPWALIFVTSDEEREFPFHSLLGRNRVVWVQTPGADDTAAARVFGHGYTPGTRDVPGPGSKPLPWFFAGQVTHSRRVELADALYECPPDGGHFLATKGFTQGYEHGTYLEVMATAKVAPCPSGPATQDSFRLWEALELGCVPIADAETPDGATGYWEWIFGPEHPIPTLHDWAELDRLIPGELADWPMNANMIGAWYMGYKRDMATSFVDDLWTVSKTYGLSSEPSISDQITVLVPTSPSPSHPSTAMLEETIRSIRHHLPTAEIIVSCDGVAAGLEYRRADYEEYVRRVVWLSHHEWVNVLPVVHDQHLHQGLMARHALSQLVTSPLVLYVEHDTPLVTDEPIDWAEVTAAVLDGTVNLVRFHHEAQVPEPHLHLMIDNPYIDGNWYQGYPVVRTMQWSQRPHLARSLWYQSVVEEYFGLESRTMIEDVMHGVVDYALREHGPKAWEDWKLTIYAPRGQNWKRSLHSDGRDGDAKTPMVFAYDGPTPEGAPAPTAGRVD